MGPPTAWAARRSCRRNAAIHAAARASKWSRYGYGLDASSPDACFLGKGAMLCPAFVYRRVSLAGRTASRAQVRCRLAPSSSDCTSMACAIDAPSYSPRSGRRENHQRGLRWRRKRGKYHPVDNPTHAFIEGLQHRKGKYSMNVSLEVAERPRAANTTDFDAIIIGAGISGMFMLYRLRELGMTVRVFETGSDIGGTWYWNRYPGARFDSESWTYGFSFSKELMQEWDWKEHFS